MLESQPDMENGMQPPPPVAAGFQCPAGSQASYQQLLQMLLEMRNELAALRALTHPPGGAQAAMGEPPALPVHRNLFSAFQASDEIDLRDIDKKDVAPPGKYRGDAAAWRHWYTKFTTFLTRRDSRWGLLLDAIRKHSTNPYSEEDVQGLFALVGVKSEALVSKFKHQLYEYLETYSEGLTHSMVMSGGPMNVVEAFRQLCDEGFSARDRNLRKEYRKVAHPKQATFEGLKRAILDWENELAQYELASGKTMSEADKVMCLEDICPDILQQHFETKENLKGYAAYKTVINDFLVNRSRWAGRSRLNWMGFSEPAAEEGEEDQSWEEEERLRQIEALIGQSAQLSAVSADVSAILRSKFVKRPPKGTGKRGGKDGDGAPPGQSAAGTNGDVEMNGGKGGKGKGRKCYECDQDGHIAAHCPIRIERIKA